MDLRSTGAVSAIILGVVTTPFVVVLLRWKGRFAEVGGWRVVALILGFGAIVELASAPFAHTSNSGTNTIGSQSTTLLAGIALAVGAACCWVIARLRAQ
jgi:drug/metabolite transporter (DMT)-like permease